MPIDVTFDAAFLAGLISFVSPCVLPLVPPYLCYLAGVSLDQLTGDAPTEVKRRTVVFSSMTFVLGFSTVFVALGAGASVIGQFVRSYMDILSVVGGAIIIVMSRSFLDSIVRVAMIPGIAQAKEPRSGMNAFPWSPTFPITLSMMNAARAM